MSWSDMTFKQKVKGVLSAWAALSSFSVIFALFVIKIPDGQHDLVYTLATCYITGSVILVYSYYFGDSDAVD